MWSGQATTSVSHAAGMGRGSLPKRDIQVERDTGVHHCLSPLGRIVPSRACPSAFLATHRGHAALWSTRAAHSVTASICVSSLAACLVEAKEWHLTEYSLPPTECRASLAPPVC